MIGQYYIRTQKIAPGGIMRGSCLSLLVLAACNTDRTPDAGPCPGGLCVTADPACGGVICDAPPSACHRALGTCRQGACTYEVETGAACNDGNACTDGDTCLASGACAGTLR